MSAKNKLYLVIAGLMFLTALILNIRQKIDPVKKEALNLNINQQTLMTQQLTDQMGLDLAQGLNTIEQERINANINVNANNKELKEEIVQKFKVDFYDSATIFENITELTDMKLSSITLFTEDDKDAAVAFYKQQLGDQAKQTQILNKESIDNIETNLILFSSEENSGQLTVKIYTDKNDDKTYINLSISDDFKDPREK